MLPALIHLHSKRSYYRNNQVLFINVITRDSSGVSIQGSWTEEELLKGYYEALEQFHQGTYGGIVNSAKVKVVTVTLPIGKKEFRIIQIASILQH